MKSIKCSVDQEAPADELGSHVKAQNGQSVVCEVKNMEEYMNKAFEAAKAVWKQEVEEALKTTETDLKSVGFCEECGKAFDPKTVQDAPDVDNRPLCPDCIAEVCVDLCMEVGSKPEWVAFINANMHGNCTECLEEQSEREEEQKMEALSRSTPEGVDILRRHGLPVTEEELRTAEAIVEGDVPCPSASEINHRLTAENTAPDDVLDWIDENTNLDGTMKQQPLAAVTGDIIEMETDNGMLLIDNVTKHTYGFLGHKTPVLASVDGSSAFGLKEHIEPYITTDGLWEGYMANKDMFRQLVRIGIVYQNMGRWHVNQQIIEHTDDDLDRIIRIHNASDKRRIDMGVDENGTRRYALSDGVYTCVGDPRHAINKLHYRSRKKRENLSRYKEAHPAKKGSYFWLKEHLRSAEIMENMGDKDVITLWYDDGDLDIVKIYRDAKYSKKQTDYIWSAKFIYRLVEQNLRNTQRHNTQGQKDCYGKHINPMVWQPSRQEVFTEITGADLFNEKIRNSRNRKTSPEEAPEPIVTDEDRETLRILHQQARDQIYRYREAQKDLETDNRTDLEKTYNGIFDKIYGRKNSHTSF